MTDRIKFAPATATILPKRSLLMRGLAWVGSVGMLSSGMIGAQTPPPDAVVVPVISEPAPAEVTPVEIAPPASVVVPVQVEPPSAPPAANNIPAAQPESIDLPAPAASGSSIEPPSVIISAPTPSGTPAATGQNEAYIDPTNYSTGATNTYDGPSAVVITERSTGCQAVLKQGQGVSNQLCSSPATPTNSVKPEQTATWRPQPRTDWAQPQVSSANVSPLSRGTNGYQTSGPTASGFNFYNPGPKPLGRLGNGNISLLFPVSIPAPITSLFGWRSHPITGDLRFHSGTDIGAPMGAPVLAAFSGQVSIADYLGGYGLAVVLSHNKATQETLYAHLAEIFVKPGEWVEQGSVIGLVGSTGNSTGPHLHFEFRQLTTEGWVAMDPVLQLESAMTQLANAAMSVPAKQASRSTPQPQAGVQNQT